jgi:hypothetical protein
MVCTRSLYIKVPINLTQLNLAVESYLHKDTKSLHIVMTPGNKGQDLPTDTMRNLERKCPKLIKLTLVHPCYTLRFEPASYLGCTLRLAPATKMNCVWDDGDANLEIKADVRDFPGRVFSALMKNPHQGTKYLKINALPLPSLKHLRSNLEDRPSLTRLAFNNLF